MAMIELDEAVKQGRLQGRFDEAYEGVAKAFVANFKEREEVGAAVCVQLDGETKVDLWGGEKTKDQGDSWDEDTLSIVFSCTKGVTALAFHQLVEQGVIDLDAPIAQYWPEFAAEDKENATVAMALDHTVGLPVAREQVKAGGVYDFDYMCDLLARQKPEWQPGHRNSYHGLTYAWTVGGIIYKATGKMPGEVVQELVAGPTGADFWIGLPEDHEARVAPIIPAPLGQGAGQTPFGQKLLTEPDSIPALFLFNSGGWDANSSEAHKAQICSANGISNARGLATCYAPFACGGELNGHHYVNADTLRRMGEVSAATHEDPTLMIPTRFALGFMKSMPNRILSKVAPDMAVMGSHAFGHVGAGGSIGLADPEARLSFGYNMNQMGTGLLMNERGQSLLDAAYQALGYRSRESGVWLK